MILFYTFSCSKLFVIDVGPLFQTPEEVVLQALDSDVHVIGISSQAAGHRTLLPALKKELEDKGASDIVVVCGGVIPAQDYDFLLKETKFGLFGMFALMSKLFFSMKGSVCI